VRTGRIERVGGGGRRFFRARVRWIRIKPKHKYFEASQHGEEGDHQLR